MKSKLRKIDNELKRLRIFARHDRETAILLLKKDVYKLMSKLSDSFRKDFERHMEEYVRNLDRPKESKVGDIIFFHRVRDLESLSDIFHTKDYGLLKDFMPGYGDYVIDAGAGVGEYTIAASVTIGRSGKILAVEANSQPFRYLKKNASMNPFKNIVALRAAVAGKNGKLKLFRPAGTSFVDSIIKSWVGKTESYLVRSFTVDTLVKKFGMKKLDILKLDIEGAELVALKGAKKTLSEMRPKIIIETHGKNVHNDVVSFLRKQGYGIDLEKKKFDEPFIALVYASPKVKRTSKA